MCSDNITIIVRENTQCITAHSYYDHTVCPFSINSNSNLILHFPINIHPHIQGPFNTLAN